MAIIPKSNHAIKEIILLILIICIGIFTRLWKLDNLPNGLDSDVVASAANSLHIFNQAEYRSFQLNPFVDGPVAYLFWSMPLGAFLIAISINLFTDIQYGILFSSAFVGIIALPLTYLLTKVLSNTNSALIATLLFAVSPWHLLFSRSGFTHIAIVTTFIVAALLIIKKAIQTKNKKYFLLAGLIWGVILFNAYPITFIVGPITILYLISVGKWKWLYSKNFILGVIIAISLYLLLAYGFALQNKSEHPFVVLQDSYHQWISVRLNETRNETNIAQNLIEGIEILFSQVPESYHFGLFRIFNYPLLNPIVGILFVTGLVISLIRMNNSDKLLIIWTISAFALASTFTRAQERYLLALLPLPYIFSGMSINHIFRLLKRFTPQKFLLNKFVLMPLFILAFLIYFYYYSYQPYFVSYAANNSNLTQGLGERDLGIYLKDTYDPKTTLLVKVTETPFMDLSTNYYFNNQIKWQDFISDFAKSISSTSALAKTTEIEPYEDHPVEYINDGNLNTFWYGTVPTSLEMHWPEPIEINGLRILFDYFVPSERGALQYSAEKLDTDSNTWSQIHQVTNQDEIQQIFLKNLQLNTSGLRFNFDQTFQSDNVQKVEEVIILDKAGLDQMANSWPPGIQKIVFIMSLNPNFTYYGNYNDHSKNMKHQAGLFFDDFDAHLDKEITNPDGVLLFQIYSFQINPT